MIDWIVFWALFPGLMAHVSFSQESNEPNEAKIEIIDSNSEKSENLKKLSVKKTAESAIKEEKPVKPEIKRFPPAPSLDELVGKPIYWMCRNGGDVRTLKVGAENGSCTTYYSKEGTEKAASQSQISTICYQVFVNIKKNLEAANYKCKDISSSKTSAAK